MSDDDLRTLIATARNLHEVATGPYWTDERQQARARLINVSLALANALDRLVDQRGEQR